MASSVHIIPMSSEQAEAVYALSCECFSTPWSFQSIAGEIKNPHALTLVALREGKVVGYLNVHHVLDEGNINLIAVRESARREGIATMLMKALFERAENAGISSYMLEVRVSNQAAVSFYTRMGFLEVGLRKGYYQKPEEDALLMKKEL